MLGTGHDDSLRLRVRLAVELESSGHFHREGGEERQGLGRDAGRGRGGAPGDFVGWADALLDAVGVGVLLLDGRTRGDLEGAMEGSGTEL